MTTGEKKPFGRVNFTGLIQQSKKEKKKLKIKRRKYYDTILKIGFSLIAFVIIIVIILSLPKRDNYKELKELQDQIANLEMDIFVQGIELKDAQATLSGIQESCRSQEQDQQKIINAINSGLQEKAFDKEFLEIRKLNIIEGGIKDVNTTGDVAEPNQTHGSPDEKKLGCIKEIINRRSEYVDIVQYAYDLSKGDMDFVLTIEAESSFNPKAIGDGGNSHGLCQRHNQRHSDVTSDDDFDDPYRQVEECYRFYTDYKKRGVIQNRIYGYNVRNAKRSNFTLKYENICG